MASRGRVTQVHLVFRCAEPRDADVIRSLQEEAVKWLADKGTDQWQPEAMKSRRRIHQGERSLESAISRGEVWLVDSAGVMVGSFVLDTYADRDFWQASDRPEHALYVHRMVVARAASGKGIGSAILTWASNEAARQGRLWLRLDAWRTNQELHEYYIGQGFELVRIVTLPDRGSGALFQKTVP
jgi:GNAT superfamily N-acetyltransferase